MAPRREELFYIGVSNMLTAVEVNASGDALRLGAERALFTLVTSAPRSPYDVAPDGRFLAMSLPQDQPAAQAVTIVLNWPALLRK